MAIGDRRSDAMPAGVVTVVGRRRAHLGPIARRDLPTVEVRHAIRCASGERTAGCWRGVAVADLLDVAAAPGETTHLFVEGRDGYRVGVELRHALDGLLAVERDGTALPTDGPRFVAPGVEGERAVRDVVRVETVTLAPGETAADREVLDPDD